MLHDFFLLLYGIVHSFELSNESWVLWEFGLIIKDWFIWKLISANFGLMRFLAQLIFLKRTFLRSTEIIWFLGKSLNAHLALYKTSGICDIVIYIFHWSIDFGINYLFSNHFDRITRIHSSSVGRWLNQRRWHTVR